MPSAPALVLVERRLAELNCPAAPARRKIRELAEHHDDLKRDALEEGLSEADAEARADELLGEPAALAEQLAFVLRQSSWWGRHPVLGFCILPPFAVLFLFFVGLAVDAGVGCLYFTKEQLAVLLEPATGLGFIRASLEITTYGTLALITILFCALARRTVGGIRWTFIACAACAVQGAFFYNSVQTHNFSLGYRSNPNWIGMAVPIVIGLAAWWKMRWTVNEIPLPIRIETWRTKQTAAKAALGTRQPQKRWVTPSSVIAALLLAALAVLIAWAAKEIQREHSRAAEWKSHVWPAERAVAIAKVASRQTAKDTHNETTIALAESVNASLADSLDTNPDAGGSDLAELPMGIHIFGGVPFDVSGRVQLLGRSIVDAKKQFPTKIKNIAIDQKCARIYLLQGALGVKDDKDPAKIARLVLHYSDGYQEEIAIVSGEHLLNWRGPIYSTGVGSRERNTTAEGTELAWVGSNKWLQKNEPENSLRIYRSGFVNPRPNIEITSVDYVSTVTDAAPFLLGLTVE